MEYNTAKTIVDSGTTNLRLPELVFKLLMQKLKSRVSFLLLVCVIKQFVFIVPHEMGAVVAE